MAQPLWKDLRRAREQRSLAPLAQRSTVPLPPRPRFGLAIESFVIAIAAVVLNSQFSALARHNWLHEHPWVWRGSMSAVFLIFGCIAARRLSTQAGRVVHVGAGPSAGSAIRLLGTIAGVIVVVIVTIGMLGVTWTRLVTAAGLGGIVLGLAAQQSLGNIFAGLVLMIARPFRVGDKVRVRSGSFGGIFDGQVRGMGLTYVEIDTEADGLLRVPNLAFLSTAAVSTSPRLPLPPPAAPPAAPAPVAPVPSVGSVPPVAPVAATQPPGPGAGEADRDGNEDGDDD